MKRSIRPSRALQVIVVTLLVILFIYATSANIKIAKERIVSISSFNYILSLLSNFLLLILIYFFIAIKLIIKISNECIQYKLSPWHFGFKKINKEQIRNIKISSRHFHIGIGLSGSIDYALGSGVCLSIETIAEKKYLLSTGLNKLQTLELLDNYGYINKPLVSLHT